MDNTKLKRIAVLGVNGMLGHMVTNVLSKNLKLIVDGYYQTTPARIEKGVNYIQIEKLWKDHEDYDYLINCIGHISQKGSESIWNIRKMIEANTLIPIKVALLKNVKYILHQSSDGVYGESNDERLEYSQHNPISVHDKTKSLGEVTASNVYNFRCSLIGPELNTNYSLLSWFLSQTDEVNGYTNVFWNGVTTLQMAQIYNNIVTNDLLQNNRFQNIVPMHYVTKHRLLCLINTYFEKNTIIRARNNETAINRVLATQYPKTNLIYWGGSVKTIEQMVEELAAYKL